MPISAVQFNASSGASASVTAPLGSNIRAGGIAVLFVMAYGSGTTTGSWSAVSGLTALGSGTVTAASTWLSWRIYWAYYATTTGGPIFSPTWSSTLTRQAWYVVEYAGLSSSPFGTLNSLQINTSGTTIGAPTQTLINPPSALISFAGAAGSSTGGVVIPSGMTSSAVYSGNTTVGGGIAHQTGLTGSTGVKTWTGLNYTVAAGLSIEAYEAPERRRIITRSGAITRSSNW
jgi:hypothetical protein